MNAFEARMAARWYSLARCGDGQRFIDEFYKLHDAPERSPRSRLSYARLYEYGNALRWVWKSYFDGAGFGAALAVASESNYLGDFSVVERVVNTHAEAILASLREPSNWEWYKAQRTEFILIFRGQHRDFTPVGAWNTEGGMEGALRRHVLARTGFGSPEPGDMTLLLHLAANTLELALRHVFFEKYHGREAAEELRLRPHWLAMHDLDVERLPQRPDPEDQQKIQRYTAYLAAVLTGWPVEGCLADLVLEAGGGEGTSRFRALSPHDEPRF